MLNHKGTVTIETERLILRRFALEDAEAMYRNWASDDEVTKHLTWPTHSSVETSKMVLTDWISHYPEPDFYNWAIVLKENGPEPIGNISVVGIDNKVDAATMGYCMSRAHWGKGVMTEALTAVIDFFFDEVGFNRIDADHAVDNPASGRVLEKSGMRYEGTHRQAVRTNCGIVDIKKWAILKSDR